MISNKKGQWIQVSLAVVIILVLAFVAVFSKIAFDAVNVEIQASDMTNESKVSIQQNVDAYPSMMDSIIMFFFIGMWISCLILAYFSSDHPLMGVIAILLIIVLGVVGMFLSNVWNGLETDPTTSSVVTSFPMTNFILQNYLITVIVMSGSTLMVMFLKTSGVFL